MRTVIFSGHSLKQTRTRDATSFASNPQAKHNFPLLQFNSSHFAQFHICIRLLFELDAQSKCFRYVSLYSSWRTQGGHPTEGKFSCGAAQLATFSSQLFMTQYHSPLVVRSSTFVLASMIRRTARHLPHDGLQHRIHSYASLVLLTAARFLPRVNVGWRVSYNSFVWRRRTQTRMCFRARASAADSGVGGAS
jgi:hypothetical protein